MKKLVLFAIILAAPLFLSAAGPKPKQVTLTGEIIDVQCYVKSGQHGKEHLDCATTCIKGGSPVGLLEDSTGTVYVIIPQKGSRSANVALQPYIAEHVAVNGELRERGKTVLLFYSSIERLK
ncbi:MAG TPA: hypothetical protein VMF59_03440 [Bacteroidota bacterium]|nr:hypothetical protein [Bacteroidota bacterium]